MARRKNTKRKATAANGANLGFEDKLWAAADKLRGFRARHNETLFIDARKMGMLIDHTHRELSDEEIKRIADTYHAWRSAPSPDALHHPCIRRLWRHCPHNL